MGARIEYDMRAEIFSHYQKLSFRFYDDQKVGQLMSRITSDLFEMCIRDSISYPVLYSGDDETYLRSDIYGNYHIAGCIFLEGMNQPDFSDYHSIIYGHNMRNTTMFGDCLLYTSRCV